MPRYGSPGYGTGQRGSAVSPPSTGGRRLLGLDLYAGAGGLSFMDGECKRAAGGGAAAATATAFTQWAVDIDPMACNTFKRNNPESRAAGVPRSLQRTVVVRLVQQPSNTRVRLLLAMHTSTLAIFERRGLRL